MSKCLECGKEFQGGRTDKRFCNSSCKDIFHNREKKDGAIRLNKQLREQLKSLASAHKIPINEMACLIFHQAMNPDGQPLTDAEIYGRDT